jgi:alpha-1,3-mannosyltransferase
MRILQVARQFHPKIGGIESCVLNLSRGLIERGHHVEVVTLDRDLKTRRRLDSSARIDSIPVHRISYLGPRRYPIAPSWLRFTDDFDVIHIHAIDFFVDSAALGKSLGLQQKPFVVTTHGGIFHTSAWLPLKKLYWRHILSRSLGAADAVVAVSDNDASLFGSIVPPHKLVTIPNGIDGVFAKTKAARVRGRLVCVGRVSDGKAIDKIIRLLSIVALEFPDLELVIAGPTESDVVERLRRMAGSLQLTSRVHVVGELPVGELAQQVASAHLFVSAAPHEGFGIATVEALAAGVPVLVTRTGIHEQIVRPGVNGWFWSGLPDGEAAAILREALLLPDARLDEMKLAARRSAAPYDWSQATEKYERVLDGAYRKSIGGSHVPR